MEKLTKFDKNFWYMVMLTPIGGLSFPLVRYLLVILGPFELLSYRMLGGATVLILFKWKYFFKVKLGELRAGIVSGSFVGGAMGFLVYGMQTTGGGQSAFILSTQVVVVPILRRIFWHEKISKKLLLSILICFSGLCILTFKSDFILRTGDVWILLGALCVASFSIANSHYSSQITLRTLAIGIWQIFTAGLLLLLGCLLFENPKWQLDWKYWPAMGFLVLISTSFRYLFQLKLQGKISATWTGLIFTLEPVWAALFCWLFLNEMMEVKELVGGAIIFLGLVLAKR